MERMKRIAAASMAAALLVFASAVAARNWWGERLLSQAQTEQKRGNVNGASELYGKALRFGRHDAAVALARMAYYRRQWDEVRRYGARAIAINPMRGYIHVLLAYTRAAESDISGTEGVEHVLDECRRAVALEPTNGSLWKSCADLSLQLIFSGDALRGEEAARDKYRDETIGAYRQAIRHSPGEAKAIVSLLAEVYPDDEFLLEVVGGGDSSLVREMVGALLEQGHWEDARAATWRESSSSGSPRMFTLAVAEALRRAGRQDEAFAALTDYLRSAPDDGEVHYRAAEISAARGKKAWKETRSLYSSAIDLEPENGVYRRRYGIRLLAMGDLEEARSQLTLAVERDPRDAQAIFNLGRVLEREKDLEGARTHYRRALSLKPEHQAYRQAVEALR